MEEFDQLSVPRLPTCWEDGHLFDWRHCSYLSPAWEEAALLSGKSLWTVVPTCHFHQMSILQFDLLCLIMFISFCLPWLITQEQMSRETNDGHSTPSDRNYHMTITCAACGKAGCASAMFSVTPDVSDQCFQSGAHTLRFRPCEKGPLVQPSASWKALLISTLFIRDRAFMYIGGSCSSFLVTPSIPCSSVEQACAEGEPSGEQASWIMNFVAAKYFQVTFSGRPSVTFRLPRFKYEQSWGCTGAPLLSLPPRRAEGAPHGSRVTPAEGSWATGWVLGRWLC